MEYQELEIPGVWLLTPKRFGDNRGYFAETYRKSEFDNTIGHPIDFIQDNESLSAGGVLRGLHFQRGEASQAKLVRVVEGTVVDIVVDLRAFSPTFGRHLAVTLSDDTGCQLFVPRGFAHGFIVLSPRARFIYKVDNYYNPAAEVTLRYDDPKLGIRWPEVDMPLNLSPKDLNGHTLQELIDLNYIF
ncbi:MAG: dTDP-4-dehydrorhamnose 3,5-epimerase [Muribaculaceae bacterium]|nr:dTDP-4-dehydrorhamnose 3,5-epimerase [Muribaculaceae bacterium]